MIIIRNYTYAEATLSQQLPDWIGSHVRAFQNFGCAPKVVVPDCLKGAVARACRYEPDLNPTYTDLAEHYGICVLPARPARPRNKAKVETGVLVAKRWLLAVLRHHTFYSLAELNGAIGELLEHLNSRGLRKLKQSRGELFKLFDHPNALSRTGTQFFVVRAHLAWVAKKKRLHLKFTPHSCQLAKPNRNLVRYSDA